MDTRYLAYATADPDFYENQTQELPAEDALGPYAVRAGVEVSRRGPFVVYRHPRPIPDTGWKVHVSCVPARAEVVVPQVVARALAAGCSCKHLASRRLVASTQAKYAEPTFAGKVLTVYPPDQETLEAIVAGLAEELAGERGARILSDIPHPEAPVSVRFGAFRGALIAGADGRLRPARRDGGGIAVDPRPVWRPGDGTANGGLPPVVARMSEAARERERDARLPISQVRLLHRSSAGGVYAARWSDGSSVVLKEARHHTGFDLMGSDAVTRLQHEWEAMTRLSGLGVAPEPVQYLTVGDSDFLVMEQLEGRTVTHGLATKHPGAVAGADGAAYRTWMDEVVAQTRAALLLAHGRGVVHRDVHPGNLIQTRGRVALIDFESSAIDGEVVAAGVATPLSNTGDDRRPQADLDSLERMRRMLVNPCHTLTVRRPELAAEITAAGEADLRGELTAEAGGWAGPQQTVAGGRSPRRELGDALWAGVRASITPDRTDRVLPGDIETFLTPGAGLGLLHGAAGILSVALVCGRQEPDGVRDWVLDTLRAGAALQPGMGDGAAGIAVVLARLGLAEEARGLLRRSREAARGVQHPGWKDGAAGLVVAHAEVGALLGCPELTEEAERLAEPLLDLLEGDRAVPGCSAGLLRGWSGIALALLRFAEHVESGSLRARAEVDPQRVRACAARALVRELGAVVTQGTAVLTKHDGRLMPYLGTGSAALGLAADALLAAEVEVPGADLPAIVERVVAAVSLPEVACGGLLHGRTGLALTAIALGGDAQMHLDRLHWATLPWSRLSRREDPRGAGAVVLLGDQNLRASSDLATGSAGAVLLCDDDPTVVVDRVREVLLLPTGRVGTRGHVSGAGTR